MRTYWLFLLAALAVVSLTFPLFAIAAATVVCATAGAGYAAVWLRRWWGNVALFGLVLAICGGLAVPVAVAQEMASTKVSLAPLAELLGLAGLAIGAALTAILGAGYRQLHLWTGITVEANHREALHSAVMTGVNAGLAKVEDLIGGAAIDVRSTAVAEAVNYVLRAVPDAVRFFGLDRDRVAEMALAKLLQVQNSPSRSPFPLSSAAVPA